MPKRICWCHCRFAVELFERKFWLKANQNEWSFICESNCARLCCIPRPNRVSLEKHTRKSHKLPIHPATSHTPSAEHYCLRCTIIRRMIAKSRGTHLVVNTTRTKRTSPLKLAMAERTRNIEKENRNYNLQRVYAYFFHAKQLYNNLS